ncbi:MAG: hypothetical protein J5X23_10090 [Candidatus Accumulibacter sp.]|jgi:hypothetical protein|uniref:hypothetical protein n=1 Tax=Accumulibacter sp. TaxID=2053492 RepID=UPI001B13C7F7|nr:hypothetical protein [Accumulibacter sp.]MBO3715305.1 hypothetical protein [Accumulibacter sp.]
METQVRVAERSAVSTSIAITLDGYLDGVADASMIFRSAVDAYLREGSERACWQLARRIADIVRTLDDMQQTLEMRHAAQAARGGVVGFEPLTDLSRLVKDMKRQITGFAIECGFTRCGRRVPAPLVADVQELTDEVCAAIDALVEASRPGPQGWQQPAADADGRGVGWHEARADRLSTALVRRILADEALEVKARLLLAQFVEEIDRLADQAEGVAGALQTRSMGGSGGGAAVAQAH